MHRSEIAPARDVDFELMDDMITLSTDELKGLLFDFGFIIRYDDVDGELSVTSLSEHFVRSLLAQRD